MMRIFAHDDQPQKLVTHYGKIRAGLYNYITPPMVIALALMITIVVLGFDKIKTYFMHGPVLNGLMLIVISTGIAMAVHSNLSIYYVARLLKKIEAIGNRGSATPEEVHKLRTSLEGKANLLSMAIFSTALEKLHEMPTLKISDGDSRLIKSKFGARVAHMRSKVNYFCGILVMLGLIGTFWGLLGTITSVGQAMTKISDNFAVQSAAGAGSANVDMGGFLQSISKPLEGMGVGFSASLFGLTGSLFLGFFNFLCGHAQNKFIENFGRWIDDCIPSIPANFVDKVKDAKMPGTEELKAWLAGFVYLSNKTHQQIGELVTALTASSQLATARLEETQKLYANQGKVLKELELGNRRMKGIHASIHSLGSDIKSLSESFKTVPEGLGKLAALVGDGLKAQKKTADAQLSHIGDLFKRIETHSLSLSNAAEAQTQLLLESHQVMPPAQATATTDLADIKAGISALLEEMHNKNDEALLGMFLRDGASGAKSIDGLFGNAE